MIGKLKPYPAYKQSGLPYAPVVPGHWKVAPGFCALEEKCVKNFGLRETTVLSLSYGRIIVKPPDKLRGLVPESFETYQIVDPDDIIIRATDLQNDQTSLQVGIVRNRGIITSAYLCLRRRGELSAEYGHLFLYTLDSTKVLYGMGSGMRQNLDFRDFKRMPVLLPPPDEQHAIVGFLDWATRRVDRAIRIKRKLIALLNEQKQVIIHRAVTRGLDPDLPSKRSGISWLPEIAAHWEGRRNSRLFSERIEKGRADLPILIVSLRTGVTVGSEVDDNGRPKRLLADPAAYKFAALGDIAYNMMRMWQGAVGVVPEDGLVSPAYVVARPRPDVCARYYELLFRTDDCKNEVNRSSRGIVSDRNRLYWDQFKRLVVPFPPFEEQKRIVLEIDAETRSLDRAVNRILREIELLREYRTRLIADVVTGKFDVRGLDLPAEETVETGGLEFVEEPETDDEELVEEYVDAD